jgi:hypothetical protein
MKKGQDELGIQHKTYQDYLREPGASGDPVYEETREGQWGRRFLDLEDWRINKKFNDYD